MGMEVKYVGKQRGHRNKQSGDARTLSVNPIGRPPDDSAAGEVLNRGHELAKKKNTK